MFGRGGYLQYNNKERENEDSGFDKIDDAFDPVWQLVDRFTDDVHHLSIGIAHIIPGTEHSKYILKIKQITFRDFEKHQVHHVISAGNQV